MFFLRVKVLHVQLLDVLEFKENSVPLITFWSQNDLCHSLEYRDGGRSDVRVHCVAVAPKWASFRGMWEDALPSGL